MIKRKLNFRPTWNLTTDEEPCSSNYYTINSAIYIEDQSNRVT